MAATPMTWQVTPGSTETTVYTVPSSKTLILLAIRVVNNDSSAHPVYVSRVPSGGTAGNANRIIPGSSVEANGVIADSDSHVLTAGQFLSVKSDSSLVTFTISGALQ